MTMIAYVGPDLPQDLLAATGACSGPVAWNVDRAMPTADRWLESKFPFWARSIVQDWADGALDSFDAVIFSRADDAAQRLYYYICELRRQGEVKGPEPLIFDVARIARSSSAAHMVAAVRQLADRLGLNAPALERGIAETNRRRASASGMAGMAARCCLLAGTPPPDRRLHAVIEAARWSACGPTLVDAWQDPGAAVEEASGDPITAIARQLHAGSQSGRAFFDRASDLVDRARTFGASAVVLWFAEEDEARIWHLPAQREALSQAGISNLIMTRRDWRGTDGAAGEITQFLKELSA
ncbi:hypothetical protein M2336_003140 [Sphingobium sp. B1D7B]|uniref:hypothetical protein n=2 Tax=unclassified Sphingobium TaxID=2611147 RepID=UPI00222593AE|nr:hypothetical protein [Sphingobium sp. B11D3A]MCW2391300.1 hypothetical protein [Sphingobium sp. B11D3A]MCW2406511.1 hypothetical protein [Sphingobium sp. B1D7B]